MSRTTLQILKRREPLRVGFLPVSDCAPLVYASETGLFAKYDLDVELCREASSTELRNKVIQGTLEAAQAPATLPFLANLERENDDGASVCAMVLSLQGNAITISRQLWEDGVRDGSSLKAQVHRLWGKKTFTLGVPATFSTEAILLNAWLKSSNADFHGGVRFAVVPPAQMFPTLKLGYIDGYCAGEPWSSMAVQAGVGVCVATSAELSPRHPQKVLMVRHGFALGRADEHERLIAALLEACAFCDVVGNRPMLSEMLAQSKYVNAPAECLNAGLVGPFKSGADGRGIFDLNIFHGQGANEPTDEKAAWMIDHLYRLLEKNLEAYGPLRRAPVLQNPFRREIFEKARGIVPRKVESQPVALAKANF
jgi:ABC-type nitrate/sulfonate/bicarbonate transport system substrate-binding protein